MPARIPLALLVLALGLTLGLVGVAVVAERAPGSGAPAVPGPQAATPGAVGVLHGWDARRARAWASGDPEALARLYTAGSSAGAADVALLRRYAERGLVVRDLRMQVLRARVLVARPRMLRLEVTDRLASAVAARPGLMRPLPVDTASTRVLVLRRVGGRWLMASVSAAAGR